MQKNNAYKYSRDQKGFTLAFAVILCFIFASLLYGVFYFTNKNTINASQGIFKSQSIYLAESGNNRALARLNVKTLPEIDLDEIVDEGDEEVEEDFDDEFFDEESSEIDDDSTGGNDDLGSDDDEQFLAKVPRYINFYHKNPYFVNIDTGHRVTQAQYYAMIQDQQNRLNQKKDSGNNEVERPEIPVQELYFPLPEVNVQKIGSINIEKGLHIRPGFRLVLSERSPVKLKQKNIVDEYLNYIPESEEALPRPVLRGIEPNFARPGELVDIFLDGDNIENILPETSSADLRLLSYTDGIVSLDIQGKTKPGKYNIKIGPYKADFYVVPASTEGLAPIITDIRLAKSIDGKDQLIKMYSKDKIENVKIIGEHFGGKEAPIVVPDSIGITIDVISYRDNEIICNITTKKVSPGLHYLTVFNKGGGSNNWVFNIEKTEDGIQDDPFIGTYTTVLTLLEINSLSNLPLHSTVDIPAPSGRPSASGGNSRASQGNDSTGRPGDSPATKQKKNFDLLRSDLETVWRLETIATVNKISYKETKIIRRTAPKVKAGLVTNTGLSFGQSGLTIQGKLEAQTRLEEPSSIGDTVLTVEGKSLDNEFFQNRIETDNSPLRPSGLAVIEDLGLGLIPDSPQSKGFSPGGFITVNSSRGGRGGFSDFGILESSGNNTITIKAPGLKNGHFLGDEVIQFIPAVICPEEISDRDAQRSLSPSGAFVNIPGSTNFERIFKTRLGRIANWSAAKTTNTRVPNDIDLDYEGYFGLNIIEGVPDYSGGNALYGQGALIIDTTSGGQNPNGGTVIIGGSSKLPSTFDGVIYIIGNLQITGSVEISGAIIVNSPNNKSTVKIGGAGDIRYSPDSINKAILHLPFSEQPRTRLLEKSKGQEELIKK